uniref:Uncharacterized protein n=1 Tax=Triticum urartu TaxID=4572 RepID=A0A8R7RBM3_TRIUA
WWRTRPTSPSPFPWFPPPRRRSTRTTTSPSASPRSPPPARSSRQARGTRHLPGLRSCGAAAQSAGRSLHRTRRSTGTSPATTSRCPLESAALPRRRPRAMGQSRGFTTEQALRGHKHCHYWDGTSISMSVSVSVSASSAVLRNFDLNLLSMPKNVGVKRWDEDEEVQSPLPTKKLSLLL